MMRSLFWLALLANMALFAWLHWGQSPQGEAEPVLHEDKVRLLDVTQLATEKPKPVEVAGAASSVRSTMQLALELGMSASAPAVPVASANQPVCLEWGEFSEGELKQVTASLSVLGLADAFSLRHRELSIGYWVYIAPLKNKAAVNQKVAQLKQRGVTEYFVVQDAGAWHNAISLGVFKTEEAAKSFMEKMHAAHVPSAQTGKRSSQIKVSTLEFNGISQASSAKLAGLQQEYPGSEIRKRPCALTR
jgi:hypothetical protein